MTAGRSVGMGVSGLAIALVVWGRPGLEPPRAETALAVIATGVPRPLQLAVDGRALIVLSPGRRGDSAGEIYRLDLDAELPVDLSRQAHVRIPFADARMATLGSLALHPATGQLFLGEENGTRIHRLSSDERLTVYVTGLQRLPGGGTLTFDGRGRLLIVDNVDPVLSPGEDRGPPGLEHLRDEDYRGPLVFRLALDPEIPLPRRLDRVPPLFPRVWSGKAGRALSPRLISVAVTTTGEVALLGSTGEVFRLTADGTLASWARLSPGYGQYNRTHMVAASDGGLFISGGFQVNRIFRVSPDGAVTTLASNLADPEGIAHDADGRLYVAESAFHRIIRLKPPAP